MPDKLELIHAYSLICSMALWKFYKGEEEPELNFDFLTPKYKELFDKYFPRNLFGSYKCLPDNITDEDLNTDSEIFHEIINSGSTDIPGEFVNPLIGEICFGGYWKTHPEEVIRLAHMERFNQTRLSEFDTGIPRKNDRFVGVYVSDFYKNGIINPDYQHFIGIPEIEYVNDGRTTWGKDNCEVSFVEIKFLGENIHFIDTDDLMTYPNRYSFSIFSTMEDVELNQVDSDYVW